MYHCFVNDLSL